MERNQELLQMLLNNEITVEQCAKLLKAMNDTSASVEEINEVAQMVKDGNLGLDQAVKVLKVVHASGPTPVTTTSEINGKMLRVYVDAIDKGKDKKDERVNIRINIPVQFLKLALISGGKMNYNGVKIDEYIDLNMVMNAIDSGMLGEIVSVDTEEAKIKVVIE
jgi:hypothetical protein